MKKILQCCATVEDVRRLLDETNEQGRSTAANLGIIDAAGGAVLFEVGPKSYAMFDAADPKVAPHGYIVRTNFSTTAHQLPAVPNPLDLDDIYSSKRFLQACRRLETQRDHGISVEYVLRNMTRDLSDVDGNPYPGSVNSVSGGVGTGELPPSIPTDQTISRTTTVSAGVFQGVRPGEDPSWVTMWTILGDPKFSVAVPGWVGIGEVADPLTDPHGGEIGEIAITLRDWSLQREESAVQTAHLPGIWQDVWAAEDQILAETHAALRQWRAAGVSQEELTRFHRDVAARAMQVMNRELQEMKQAVLEVAEAGGDDRGSRGQPNHPAGAEIAGDGGGQNNLLPPDLTAIEDPLAISVSEVRLGVYDDKGAGRSIRQLLAALKGMDGVYITRLTAEDIRGGGLHGLDVVIHPGGSGGGQGRALGEEGRESVRRFVKDGGGFLGFCAGAYLASAHYSWSLHLLDARVFDRAHWARGTGMVQIRLTEAGQQVFRANRERLEIHYGQGPLLVPGRDPAIPDYQPLATYATGIAKKGAPQGVMPGTTAIAHGTFGRGSVLCFSPHPEMTDGLESLVHRAVITVRRRSKTRKPAVPRKCLDAIRVTPDISQKGMPNPDYCAPCAVANVLWQLDQRELLQLPERFEGGDASQGDAQETGRSLARYLGDDALMETRKHRGTNRYRLVRGADKFIREQCDASLAIRYLGVRDYDEEQLNEDARGDFLATVGVPRLHHLQRRLSVGDAVIILFGSYKPNRDHDNRLERVGGHYVAAVGYGLDSDGQSDPASILLHDSNDGVNGNKYVRAMNGEESIALWANGERLAESRHWVQLENAPIRQDGRIAYLETVLSLGVKAAAASQTP